MRDDGAVTAMTLWHNPRCAKSRRAKSILDARGVAYTERRYLDDPPSAEELDAILTALGRDPWEATRLTEQVAKDLGLKDAPRDRGAWIATLAAHPILVERPILVTSDGRAALGRPPEAIEALLG
jgi:arsenate reductase